MGLKLGQEAQKYMYEVRDQTRLHKSLFFIVGGLFFLVTRLSPYAVSKSGEHTIHMIMLKLLGRDRGQAPTLQFLIPVLN